MNQKQIFVYFHSTEKKFQCQRWRCKFCEICEICNQLAFNADLILAENEIMKNRTTRSKNTRKAFKKSSKTFKKEVSEYTLIHGTQAVIKVLSKKYSTTHFFYKQDFFSTQLQCCITFPKIEIQMLLSYCLIHISIIILRIFISYICVHIQNYNNLQNI